MKTDSCVYCGTGATQSFQRFWEMTDEVSLPGIPEGFMIRQDVFPIGEGAVHLLFLPKKHSISFAALDEPGIEKYLLQISNVLQEIYPDTNAIIFEHGPGFIEGQPFDCGGCHIDHAHIHFVLVKKTISGEDFVTNIDRELIATWDNLQERKQQANSLVAPTSEQVGINPYIYVAYVDQTGEKSIFYKQLLEEEQVASQFLRRILATTMGEPSSTYWHWRDFVEGMSTSERVENLKKDIAEFRKRVQLYNKKQ